jgi:archaellum component FlaC
MDADVIKKIEEIFKHHVGMMTEDFQHKLDIVVEGHQMLVEKIDRLDGRMDKLETKVDSIATDLTAHRSDTEAHHGVYRVKEGV